MGPNDTRPLSDADTDDTGLVCQYCGERIPDTDEDYDDHMATHKPRDPVIQAFTSAFAPSMWGNRK